ncbi:MAG: alpha/beta hydrolase [Actinomycetota bacterium]
MTGIEARTVTANGLDIEVFECGEGPLAVCAHGFPDSAHTWRHLLPALANAGYRAVAPFTRGYAPTAIPADGAYQVGAQTADLNALHDVLGGHGDAVVIGHDIGAAVANCAAASAPERWSKVVTMAVPPGPAFVTALTSDLAQVKRSWYMFFFQQPLADMVVAAEELAFIDMLWADWSPGFTATDDVAAAKRSLAGEDRLAAALGFYRAAFGDGLRVDAYDAIEATAADPLPQPTLHLHGATDGCIGADVAELARTLSPWVHVEIIDGVGHFLHLEQPAVVNERIIDFLS